MRGFGGARSDPFQLSRLNSIGFTTTNAGVGLTGLDNYTTRTLVNPNSISRTNLGVIVTVGQSQQDNVAESLYVPSNVSNMYSLCVQNGGVYQALDPLLGACGTGGNIQMRLGSKLITASKYANTIACPITVGGTTIAQWASGNSPGVCYSRIPAMGARLAALGLAATVVLIRIGETDAGAGTSQAAMTAGLADMIASLNAAGMTCKKLVGLGTWIGGGLPAGSAAVRAAQAAVVDNVNVFQGFDGDTLDDTYRQGGVDFKATGIEAVAVGEKDIIIAHV